MAYEYARVHVTPKGEKFIKGGHIWVYADEITNVEGAPVDGALVTVYSQKDRFLGTGFYNSHSKIRVRILSKNANDRFDEQFWERRIRWALEYRRAVMGEADFRTCRLIFGEADAFPGLTVDRFENVLVTQVLCLGTERIKPLLYSILVKLLREEFGQTIDVLYERNDVSLRTLEGMEESTGFYTDPALGLLSDTDGLCEITENGVRYEVDYIRGQKTGFFLDQKYNRRSIHTLAQGRRVLDCSSLNGLEPHKPRDGQFPRLLA